MKIRCDVCDQAEASVFCSADEAALCHGCDLHVHRANKLAGKHSRFSLLQPIKIDSPLCDICQERRALVFCQQDRAILCRECDISIHGTNEHTQKHNRFLLTARALKWPRTKPRVLLPLKKLLRRQVITRSKTAKQATEVRSRLAAYRNIWRHCRDGAWRSFSILPPPLPIVSVSLTAKFWQLGTKIWRGNRNH